MFFTLPLSEDNALGYICLSVLFCYRDFSQSNTETYRLAKLIRLWLEEWNKCEKIGVIFCVTNMNLIKIHPGGGFFPKCLWWYFVSVNVLCVQGRSTTHCIGICYTGLA